MLTYLIEDNPLKVEQLRAFLRGACPTLALEVFGGYHSGLKAITLRNPRLILLDMTIPTYDRGPAAREGRLRPLGGHDLMRKLRLKRVSIPVIVVSQLETFGEGQEQMTFDEMTARCQRDFPDMFKGSVYFGQRSNESWQARLASLISSVGG